MFCNTHGVRQTDIAMGVVGAATVNLVRVAGLLNYHRARLHRFWSTPYTQTHREEQKKKREREARMRNKSDKACFLSRPIKKKRKRNRFDSNGTKGKGRSKINKACWVARRSLFTNKSTVVFTPVIAYFSMTPNTTDLSSDLLSVHVCVCVLSCPQLAGRGL